MITKIGKFEFTQDDLKVFKEHKRFICVYSGIYQIFWSHGMQAYYVRKIAPIKLVKKGHLNIMSAKRINDKVGEEVIIPEIY
jgi:hypothetical protein